MADEPHSFITGTLWLKLKEDVREFRVFNREDLARAAYFHIRRVLLARPGWSCRSNPPISHDDQSPPDLALFSKGKLNALFQFEFDLTPGVTGGFPAAVMNRKMTSLRRAVEEAEPPRATGSGRAARGYLVAVHDAEEEWFYPEQATSSKQSCFWLPVNCRTFADYAEWRRKWNRTARLSDH
jgi:hypothetical protein